jgi:hypothetical protein
MLSYFLFFMRQKTGNQLCVQLLQTLNILFENISNQTSLCALHALSMHSVFVSILAILQHVNARLVCCVCRLSVV